jgi:hypothetical protein
MIDFIDGLISGVVTAAPVASVFLLGAIYKTLNDIAKREKSK